MAITTCCGKPAPGSAGKSCQPGENWREVCYIVDGDTSDCKRRGWNHRVIDDDCIVTTDDWFEADRTTPVDPATITTVACPTVTELGCATVDALAEALAPFKFDTVKLCDPVSGLPVFVTIEYSDTGVPTSTAYTVGGALWVGDVDSLVACDTPETESDPVDWCIDGQDYTQHVIKRDGRPTGEVVWTDPSGAIVADPVPGATLAQKGACHLVNAPIDIPLCLPD